MTNSLHILADGFPAQLIFFGFVALIMVLSAVFGKSGAKPTPPVRLGGVEAEAARARAELQRRAQAHHQHLARGGPPAMPPVLPTQSNGGRGRQSKANRKAAARAAATAAAPPVVRAAPAVRPVAAAAAAAAEPAAPVTHRRPQGEIGRNLKLMLQRGAVREAVLLGEVLAPPKSLRDEP